MNQFRITTRNERLFGNLLLLAPTCLLGILAGLFPSSISRESQFFQAIDAVARGVVPVAGSWTSVSKYPQTTTFCWFLFAVSVPLLALLFLNLHNNTYFKRETYRDHIEGLGPFRLLLFIGVYLVAIVFVFFWMSVSPSDLLGNGIWSAIVRVVSETRIGTGFFIGTITTAVAAAIVGLIQFSRLFVIMYIFKSSLR